MPDIDIPHITGTFVERGFPNSILHVNTPLAQGPPATDAGPRHDMLVAVSKRVAAEDLDGYHIHWSGGRDAKEACAAQPT